MKKKLALLLCVVLLAALMIGAWIYTTNAEQESIPGALTAQNAVQKTEFLTYQGTDYPLKKHIRTVLLIGTDSTRQYQEQTEGLPDYMNYNQADFLMLLVLDPDKERVECIQLNRDTMTDVPWLDVLGDYGGTDFKQLCLAFNSGDGGTASCKNTVSAVSGLLFDLPIDRYIQIPMTAVPVLNDLVGGVPVTIRDDLTDVDPAFIQGAVVKLNGTQAEKFVRARMDLPDDTNQARMLRQRDYMDSFQKQAKEIFHSDNAFAMKLVEELSSYLQSDMTAQQISELIEKLDTYEVSPIRAPEGELLLGKEYYEFFVDTDSLWEIVSTACCDEP